MFFFRGINSRIGARGSVLATGSSAATPTITATIDPETGDVEVQITPRLIAVQSGDNIEVRING